MTRNGTFGEVLAAFLRLGLTSFGGPIAHLGYFRNEFVLRRRWVDEHGYADLVALCQFLPGPASSQVAFALGLKRAGYSGALAAWIGFTLPSAVALIAFASGAVRLASSGSTGAGVLHGLRIAAVAIVAQAVLGMARTLCPDRERASIGVVSTLVMLAWASSAAQVTAIAVGGIAGSWFCRSHAVQFEGVESRITRSVGLGSLFAFAVLLIGLSLLPDSVESPGLRLFGAFYHCGALVFGGGHVVLPLLREAVVAPGWVGDDVFLAGYGAAQAVPGPLFTFAAYLGAVAAPVPGVTGALVALIAIFLPGMLILVAALPLWDGIRRSGRAQAAIRGINAAVVGLLAATLYDPIWSATIASHGDFGLALVGFALLTIWRAPPLLVVVLSAAGGVLLGGGAAPV